MREERPNENKYNFNEISCKSIQLKISFAFYLIEFFVYSFKIVLCYDLNTI